MKRLIAICNDLLFAAAVPFVVLAVALLYVAYLIAGNPSRSTFRGWVATALHLE